MSDSECKLSHVLDELAKKDGTYSGLGLLRHGAPNAFQVLTTPCVSQSLGSAVGTKVSGLEGSEGVCVCNQTGGSCSPLWRPFS